MKKIVICFCLAICLVNSNLSCVSATARDPEKYYDHYSWEDQMIDGMKYRIFYGDRDISYSSAAIFAINLTKDALEIELLKKQLK